MKNAAEVIKCNNCENKQTVVFRAEIHGKEIPDHLAQVLRLPESGTDELKTWINVNFLWIHRVSPRLEITLGQNFPQYHFCSDECFLAWIACKLMVSKADAAETQENTTVTGEKP